MGPLAGIRIIDMTTVLMGPSATQMLGDMGADVIKVEPPEGDVVRQIAPARHHGMGAMFLANNRSKRSICLDLKTAGGRDALLALARDAAALVYNVRPAAMARLGLGYEALRAVNPSLVYAGLYGFGQDGPYAAKPAYDDLIQGGSGLSALFEQSGSDGPRYVPQAVADRVVGLVGSNAILAALMHRERTGQGQQVDVPMFETMASFVMSDHMQGLAFRPAMDQGGYARQLSPYRKPYRTADGHVCALVYTDAQWQRFTAAVGRPELLENPHYATFAMRAQHIDEVYATIEEIFTERTSAEWLELLDSIDVPTMPLHDLVSIAQDPHLVATGLFVDVEHPTEGPIRSIRLPATFSGTPVEIGRLAPQLGEHGAEVLREAGYDDAGIASLQAEGALFTADRRESRA